MTINGGSLIYGPDESLAHLVLLGTNLDQIMNTKLRIQIVIKGVLTLSKDGLYMMVLLASPRWRWCPGKYSLVSYSMIFCVEPENIHPDTSATWDKLMKPTYGAHLLTK